jgi:hypothetical protein
VNPVGRWWRSLDHDSPAFTDDRPERTIVAAVLGTIVLVVVAVVLIALDTGVAR